MTSCRSQPSVPTPGEQVVVEGHHTGRTTGTPLHVGFAQAGRARGVGVLDAPVSGGERGAIDGTLSIMVGGDPEDVVTAQPVLEAMGSTIVHVGAAGAGQTVKAANQLLTAVTIEAVAEAVVFLEAHGVDPTVAIGALAGGLAGSAVLDRRAPSMVKRDFT